VTRKERPVEDPKRDTIRLARSFARRGDPDGWFEEFYARAEGDIRRIYWADLKPHPLLEAWLRENDPPPGLRAATVGCGLGDDAEVLAGHGFRVTAFDISASAIAMCRERYPDSPVDYLVGDLFAPREGWRGGFDLVYECNTVQILTGGNRERAVAAIAGLTAPGGVLLVSCRGREESEEPDAFPLALDRAEIDGFRRSGLQEAAFLAYDDDQDPPVPHFWAVYRRPAG